MIHKNNYPQELQDHANELIKHLNESINEQGEDFFVENHISEEIFFNILCENFMNKFKAGEEIAFTEDEFFEMMKKSLRYNII
jgi:hypothetical protein